jgi:DNA-binding NtrC family response regulator
MSYTILILDDDRNFSRVFEEQFRKEGFRVFSCDEPVQALSHIQHREVDAIIVDPGLDKGYGLNMLSDVLNLKRDLKVIIHSEHTNYKLDFRAWAADAFLTKPSDLTQLVSTLQKVREHN